MTDNKNSGGGTIAGNDDDEAAFVDAFFLPGGILDPETLGGDGSTAGGTVVAATGGEESQYSSSSSSPSRQQLGGGPSSLFGRDSGSDDVIVVPGADVLPPIRGGAATAGTIDNATDTNNPWSLKDILGVGGGGTSGEKRRALSDEVDLLMVETDRIIAPARSPMAVSPLRQSFTSGVKDPSPSLLLGGLGTPTLLGDHPQDGSSGIIGLSPKMLPSAGPQISAAVATTDMDDNNPFPPPMPALTLPPPGFENASIAASLLPSATAATPVESVSSLRTSEMSRSAPACKLTQPPSPKSPPRSASLPLSDSSRKEKKSGTPKSGTPKSGSARSTERQKSWAKVVVSPTIKPSPTGSVLSTPSNRSRCESNASDASPSKRAETAAGINSNASSPAKSPTNRQRKSAVTATTTIDDSSRHTTSSSSSGHGDQDRGYTTTNSSSFDVVGPSSPSQRRDKNRRSSGKKTREQQEEEDQSARNSRKQKNLFYYEWNDIDDDNSSTSSQPRASGSLTSNEQDEFKNETARQLKQPRIADRGSQNRTVPDSTPGKAKHTPTSPAKRSTSSSSRQNLTSAPSVLQTAVRSYQGATEITTGVCLSLVPLIRQPLMAIGLVFAAGAKLLILLALGMTNTFKYAAEEAEHVDGALLCYLVLFLVPRLCDALMAWFSLPHYTPHMISAISMYQLCNNYPLSMGSYSLPFPSFWPRRKSKNQYSYAGHGQNHFPAGGDVKAQEICHLVLRTLRALIPFHLLWEGFSEPNSQLMMLHDWTRLLLAFVLSAVRANLILSPVAWVTWAAQVLLILYLPPNFFNGCFIAMVGLASIRLCAVVQQHPYHHQTDDMAVDSSGTSAGSRRIGRGFSGSGTDFLSNGKHHRD